MTRLQSDLSKVCGELGLRIVIPFKLTCSDDLEIVGKALLPQLGALNGTIILTDFSDVKGKEDELRALGYTASVLTEPSDEEDYDLDGWIEMFADWGWAAIAEPKPDWLLEWEEAEMMQYEDWIKSLISVVKVVADKEYQERVWLRGEGPEVDSWDETINRFFDDYDADNFVENHMVAAGLSESQQHSLRDLRDALNRYNDRIGDDYLLQTILNDPGWQRIRDGIANETLKFFEGK